MKTKLVCAVDNQVKKFFRNDVLHRKDGSAVVRGSGDLRVEEFWFEGCLVSQAMLELHRTLPPEVDEIVKMRKIVQLEAMKNK
ncbi:hypothetical protein [Ralstonia mannitolilytica]|uniref:hypothetical protein n=1 Tax=Ralstonia mannitolilytica TaxID=105219 RepID=UPI000C7E21EF|nr:hypothetical protein [Ralstonia mannitolilytica]PLT18574.1 hypothetical protein CXP34_00765 [Ralstonia mannitolilytica]